MKSITLLIALLSLTATAQINEAIRFRITDPLGHTDESIIRLKPEASPAYDPEWDAWKMFTWNDEYPSLYSATSNSESMAVNSVNPMVKDTLIPMYMRARINGGTYTMETEQLGTFPAGVKIAIRDIQTGLIWELNQNATFTFDVVSDPNNDFQRFEIFYSTSAEINLTDNDLTITNAGDYQWSYAIFDSVNTLYLDGDATSDIVQLDDLDPGSYTLYVQDEFNLIDTFSLMIEGDTSGNSDPGNTNTSAVEDDSFQSVELVYGPQTYLDLGTVSPDNLRLDVYTMTGQLIERQSTIHNNVVELNFEGSGQIYLVVLSNDTQQRTFKCYK